MPIKNLMSSANTTVKKTDYQARTLKGRQTTVKMITSQHGNKYHRVDGKFTATDTIVFLPKIIRHRSHRKSGEEFTFSLFIFSFKFLAALTSQSKATEALL